MGLHRLKSFRVGVSVLFFALIAFLFLDFRNIVAPSVSGGLLYLQFVPSLLKFVNAAALGAAGFIVIVILTVLFGRVYCSTVCPLGTLQDVISFMARKKRKRRDFQFSEPHNVLRYSILALTVLLLIAGSGFLLNLLDPFSSFGRIFSNLIRPVVLVVNNVAAIALEPLGVHTLYLVPVGGDRAGIRRRLNGDADAGRMACRDARPPVLQHRLPRGRAAGPSLEDLISSNQHRSRCLQGMQAVRRRVQGGLHRSPEEDGGYQPLRWLLQLLRSLSERRTAI